MQESKQQQIHLTYNKKMQILAKVLIITIFSTFLTLLFLDYDSSQVQLNLSSTKTNCIGLDNEDKSQKYFVCNMCFKVSAKNKTNERIRVESREPFMMVSLKEEASTILRCEEWLQAVDYESAVVTQGHSMRPVLRLQPSFKKYLAQLENEKGEILLVQKPHLQNQIKPETSKPFYQTLYSSMDRPYQVLTYYSKNSQVNPFKVYQQNEEIKTQGLHIILLVAIAAAVAIVYRFHCGANNRENGQSQQTKGAFKKYNQHIFSVTAIAGTVMWALFSSLLQDYTLFQTFYKVLFFSMVFDVIFGAARWPFFGILLITHTLLTQQDFPMTSHLILSLILLSITFIKVCSQIKSEYFHLQKNSNKKIYLLIMTLIIFGCQMAAYIEIDTEVGDVAMFLVGWLMLIGFVVGVKNLDGDEYFRLMVGGKRERMESSEELPKTNTIMFEQHEFVHENELQEVKK